MTGSAAEFPDETIDSGVVVTRWYLFADEFGNFDYTRKQGATRYFAVGTLMVAGDEGRIAVRDALNKVSDDLIRDHGLYLPAFHATKDKQFVRDLVFEALVELPVMVDVTALDKRKAQPHIRSTDAKLYQYAWFMHRKPAWRLKSGDELMGLLHG